MLTRSLSVLSLSAASVLVAASLAACGGGGGSPAPNPTPIQSGTPSNATASGTVVDNTLDTGISGVTVAIAPASSAASTTPSPVTTTAPNGTFTFTATPGSYLLVIGSNSPTDTRSTFHGEITLAAGTNSLVMGVPSPEPDVTLSPAQVSGNFRLETLSSSQSNCLSGANSGRTADALPLMVPDESLLEIADATVAEEIAQGTDTPTPLFNKNNIFESSSYSYETTSGSTSAGFQPCSAWTGTSYSYVSGNPPYPGATNAKNTLYGADLIGNFGTQIWGIDPRPY